MSDQSWMQEAACRGVGHELFFPGWGESVAEAKAICRRCPVAGPCLEYALDGGDKFGIWGGLSERERRRIRAKRRRAA